MGNGSGGKHVSADIESPIRAKFPKGEGVYDGGGADWPCHTRALNNVLGMNGLSAVSLP